jgi:hypothetical protein
MSEPLPEPERTSSGSVFGEVRALFDLVLDLSFKRFITPRLIRTLYALSLIAAVLSALAWMVSGFSTSLLYGLFTLVTGPVAFLLYVLTARMLMELVLAIFSIAEHVKRLPAAKDSSPDNANT